jgi:hypothetical protein
MVIVFVGLGSEFHAQVDEDHEVSSGSLKSMIDWITFCCYFLVYILSILSDKYSNSNVYIIILHYT